MVSAEARDMYVFFLAELRSLRARGLWLASVRIAPLLPAPFQRHRGLTRVKAAISRCQTIINRVRPGERGRF
jgi:hypothetical protein